MDLKKESMPPTCAGGMPDLSREVQLLLDPD